MYSRMNQSRYPARLLDSSNKKDSLAYFLSMFCLFVELQKRLVIAHLVVDFFLVSCLLFATISSYTFFWVGAWWVIRPNSTIYVKLSTCRYVYMYGRATTFFYVVGVCKCKYGRKVLALQKTTLQLEKTFLAS